MASTIDQKTYLLNKYLKAPSADKKKKRKKHVKGTGLRIIDDDVDVSRLRPLEPEELEALAGDEDAPQVAGIVDERPEHVRKMEQFSSSSKWRVVAQDDGFDSKIRVEEIKKNVAQMKEDDNPVFGKMYSDSEDDKKNDSDLSPPRKTTTKPTTSSHSDKSKNKQIHRNSDSDLSPLRIKSPRKSDSDQSPPRKAVTQIIKEDKSQKIKSSSEHSKKRRNSSDSDLSPPRKNDTRKPKDRPKKASRWGHFGPEESSQSQNRDHYKAQDSDQSPPRKAKRSVSPEATSKGQSRSSGSRRDNLESPAHRKSRKSSPPRQRGSDSDLSPPRKSAFTKKRDRSKDSDLSPPRKSRDGNSSKNRSPERRKPPSWRTDEGSGSFKERSRENDGRRNGAERGSQFREGGKGRDNYRENRNKSESPPPSNKKMAKTLEGKTAGLQDARQLQRENEEFRRREDELYARMSGDASGRDATTVNRRLGKRESSAEKEKKKEDKEKQKALEEKYSKWGKGLKQVAEQQARVEDYVHEASKPLARHRDDADLERTLRSVERAGDPMLEYMRGKRADNVEVAERPTYKGNWPPNRFNIRPGHRWDGVDRSNGYEVRYFEQRSKAKAVAVEAYKWSTEDL